MSSGLAKRIPPHSAEFLFSNVFGRKIRWKSLLRSGILFASPELIHRPRSDFPLHFNMNNMYQIRMEKYNASTRRLHSAAVPERWPQNCRVKITFGLLPNN